MPSIPINRNHHRRCRVVSTDSAHKVTVLMDFPTELLDLICQEADLDGLLALACLCTRLHRITLPILFNRTGFNGSSVSVGDRRSGDAFVKISKAIRLSFTTTKLDHLDCMLSVKQPGSMERMKELRKLFSRPTLVSHVDLRFTDAANSTMFPSTFFALLNSLPNIKCDRLHIQFPMFSNYLAKIGRNVEWKPVHTCKEICISTGKETYLREVLLKWLVLSINLSPIQTLRFYSNLHLDQRTLPLLLDRAKLRHLTELHISTVVIAEDILRILTRHSTIQTLNFNPPNNREDWTWTVSKHLRVCNLPYLTRLAAPATLIRHISAQRNTPKLHTVHVQPAGQIDSSLKLRIATLIAISSRRTVRRLSLFMNGGSPVIECMRHFMTSLVSSRITHLTLFSVGFGVVELLSQWIAALFPKLESLVLHELVDPNSAQINKLRKQLKEMCPNVKLVFDDNESTQWLGKPVV